MDLALNNLQRLIYHKTKTTIQPIKGGLGQSQVPFSIESIIDIDSPSCMNARQPSEKARYL